MFDILDLVQVIREVWSQRVTIFLFVMIMDGDTQGNSWVYVRMSRTLCRLQSLLV